MKRFNKHSALTVVLALMLVLSFGFYTGLSPTTAWFNATGDTNTQQRTIGTFDVSSDAYVQQDMNMTFDVTTKLSEALANDATRNKEFEYAVQYLYVTITNDVATSDESPNYLDALVKLTVSSSATNSGLRYFCFALDSSDDANGDGYYDKVTSDGNGTFTENGALSSKIRTYCSANNKNTDALLLAAMQANEIRVSHGNSVTVCMALWVDHGASGVVNTKFPITVTMNATQTTA